MDRKKVRLGQAFVFLCPECGHKNFVSPKSYTPTEAEAADLRQHFGIESWEAGEFVMAPKIVRCEKCEAIYDAEDGPEQDPL